MLRLIEFMLDIVLKEICKDHVREGLCCIDVVPFILNRNMKEEDIEYLENTIGLKLNFATLISYVFLLGNNLKV